MLTNYFFALGLLATFINLALFVSLEPVLADHMISLGVEERDVGVYFFIYASTYCIVSLLIDKYVLTYMHQRLCIISGFGLMGVGFLIIGPTRFLTLFIGESTFQVVIGLILIASGASSSFIPIFAELSESVKFKYENQDSELFNKISSI